MLSEDLDSEVEQQGLSDDMAMRDITNNEASPNRADAANLPGNVNK